MIKDDMIAKCRVVFFNALSLYYWENIYVDDELLTNLLNFLSLYINEYFDTFKLIFNFKVTEDNKLSTKESPEIIELLEKYSSENDMGKSLIKIYDDVGQDNVNKLTDLACKFCKYLDHVYENEPIFKQ